VASGTFVLVASASFADGSFTQLALEVNDIEVEVKT